MKFQLTLSLFAILMTSFMLAAEPTDHREWHAKGGFKIEAKALQVVAGNVQLERENGSKLTVALAKFTEEDQKVLREHFELEEIDPDAGPPPPASTPADDLPHPLGETTGELECGEFHYFLYLPKTLEKGADHPVLFVMSPGGGSAKVAKRYQAGAERNGWIVAVSKESKNGFNGSQGAIDAMMKEVESSISIDEKRMYTSGFSGGSRMAFATAGLHSDIAGVIACGAGGRLGSSKQVAYGLCGSNCFNRTDMAHAFKGFRHDDCLLRYIPGMHIWADAEYCDDAITHLNGVFLIKNKSKYAEELARYVHAVSELVAEEKDGSPMRAFMWADFLKEREVLPAHLSKTHDELGSEGANQLYLKGLTEVGEFAQKEFGDQPASKWESDPKVSAACLKEAEKYAGTPWQEILKKMSEDAQKF